MKMRMTLSRPFLALVMTFGSAAACFAQLGSYVNDFDAPVFAGRTNVTSLDLARKIFPDAKIDAAEQNRLVAASKIPLRVLPGITPAEDIKADGMEGNLTVRIDDFIESRDGNEKLLWLLLQAVGEKYRAYSYAGQQILAVYRVGRNTAELIDAAIVKQDDYTHFVENNAPIAKNRKLLVTPHREAVFIATRATTNGGVAAYSLVDLRDGKLSVILREFDIWIDQVCNYFI